MAIEILTLEKALEDNGLKMLVHGMAGSGKTVMSATAGCPTIILSAESGLLSLKKYMRENKSLSKNIRVLKITSFADLKEVREWLEDEHQMADWLCLDSISEIAEQILFYEKKQSNDPRKAYGNLIDQMLEELRKFRDIPGYNVMMTCKQEREVDNDTGRVKYVPSFPGTKIGPAVPYMFDEVFALRVEEDDEGEKYRTLQTDFDTHYYAKDRSGELEMFEEPNLKHLLEKINPEYVLLKDRDPETLVSANEKRQRELEAIEKEIADDTGASESEDDDAVEVDDAPETTVADNEEIFVAKKPMYFVHDETSKTIKFAKGDEVDVSIFDSCTEVSKKDYEAQVKENKAAKESQGDASWKCCECDHEMGNTEPEEGAECPECNSTDFYDDAS